MAKSFDDLIDFLLSEIALSGERGAYQSDHSVERHHNEHIRLF
jgi:hypothetical protein